MYIVIELQTNNGTTSVLNYSFDDFALAEQKFYQVLSFAVVSELEVHACVILDCCGVPLRRYSYDRRVSPEPSPEPEFDITHD